MEITISGRWQKMIYKKNESMHNSYSNVKNYTQHSLTLDGEQCLPLVTVWNEHINYQLEKEQKSPSASYFVIMRTERWLKRGRFKSTCLLTCGWWSVSKTTLEVYTTLYVLHWIGIRDFQIKLKIRKSKE